MKARLVFDLDDTEDKTDFVRCTNALEMYCALTSIREHLRQWRKYDQDAERTLEAIGKEINQANLEMLGG